MFRAAVPPFMLSRIRWYWDAAFRHLVMRPPQLPQVSYAMPEEDGTVKISALKSAR